jgi:hypothetical protein
MRRSSGLIAGWMAWCAFSWAPCVPPSMCSQSHHRSSILFFNASYQYIVVFNASTLDDSYQYIVVLILGIEVGVIFSLSKPLIYLYDNKSLYCSTMNSLVRMIFITVGVWLRLFFVVIFWYSLGNSWPWCKGGAYCLFHIIFYGSYNTHISCDQIISLLCFFCCQELARVHNNLQ